MIIVTKLTMDTKIYFKIIYYFFQIFFPYLKSYYSKFQNIIYEEKNKTSKQLKSISKYFYFFQIFSLSQIILSQISKYPNGNLFKNIIFQMFFLSQIMLFLNFKYYSWKTKQTSNNWSKNKIIKIAIEIKSLMKKT